METGHEERYKDAFRIRAIRFMTKPFQNEEVYDALKAASQVKIGNKEIEVYRERQKLYIKIIDISYVEAYTGYVIIVIGNKHCRKDITLYEIKKSLDSRFFFQINRQYVINMNLIENIKKNRVRIAGEKMIVSRRRIAEFEKCYMKFDLEYRRLL